MSKADQKPAQWREAFHNFQQEVESLTEGLPAEAFNSAPAPGRWSVGQCIDHLNETGRRLVPLLQAALATARERQASAGQTTPRLGLRDRLFVWGVAPGSWLKMPTFSMYEPAAGALDPQRTTEAFQALQEDLARCAETAGEVDWSAVRATSPASRFVRLSAGGWLAGTAAHQQRHFEQARAAKEVVLRRRDS